MPRSFDDPDPDPDVPGGGPDNTMLCRRVVTKDRRYITQITCYERGRDGQVTRTHHGQEEIIGRIGEIGGISGGAPGGAGGDTRAALRLPIFGQDGGGGLFHLDRRQLSGGTDCQLWRGVGWVDRHTEVQ